MEGGNDPYEPSFEIKGIRNGFILKVPVVKDQQES